MARGASRVRVSGVSVLMLAGLVGLLSLALQGCGDSATSQEPKVTIASVEGDGNLPGEIESAVIVTGTNFQTGDLVEFCDAETGVRKNVGPPAVTGQNVDSDTQITVTVSPDDFVAGATKTIVSRDYGTGKRVPKAIKAVTYLTGPTYGAGPGIEVVAGDIIQTKLSPTGGLDNTLDGAEERLGIAEDGIQLAHLGQMGAADGQVLKWNATNTAWEVGDDQTGGAGSGTVNTIVPDLGVTVDDTDVANPIVGLNLHADGGLDNDLDGAGELGLVDGTTDDQVLKWTAAGGWQLAADETGAGGGQVDSIVAGDGILVDATDPVNPEVSLVDGTAPDQILKWDGSTWQLAADETGAGGGQVDSIVAGSGIAVDASDPTSPIVSLNAAGAVANDILMWNGSVWALVNGSEADTLQTVCNRGRTASTSLAAGATISAENTSSTANSCGIFGYTTSGTGTTYGVHGQSDSIGGQGVYGYATATTGATYGVYGRSDSASGQGVYGWTNSATGITYGVHGTSDSEQGSGVYGHARRATGTTYGVRGESDSSAGYGVYADSNNVGLYATGTNRAARFSGQVEVTAGTGTFPIDAIYASSTGPGHIRLSDTNALGDTVDVRMGTNNNNGAMGTYSAHHLDLWAGGAPQARIQDTGNVGIGTTTPGNKLHVVGGGLTVNAGGASGAPIDLTAGSPGGGQPGAQVSMLAGTGNNNVGGDVTIESGVTSTWAAGDAHSKVALQGGDVDAGAGSGASLDVEGGRNVAFGGSDAAGGNVVVRGGNAAGSHAGGDIVLQPGTGTPDGNVGIGTASPSATLDVNGTVKATAFSGDGSDLTNVTRYKAGSVQAPVPTSEGDLMSVTITPPRDDGYYMVTVSGHLVSNGAGTVNVVTTISEVSGSHGYLPATYHFCRHVHEDAGAAARRWPIHMTAEYGNTAATPKTFYVVGDESGTASDLTVFIRMIVQWFPGSQSP